MTEHQRIAGKRILIVDDNIDLSRSTALVLTYEGGLVRLARDGGEAIRLLTEQPYDMVLLDVRMPGMNGLEAYRAMRAIRPDVRVLLMTAYAVQELVEQAIAEGAQGVVYKPFDFDKLLARIQEVETHE